MRDRETFYGYKIYESIDGINGFNNKNDIDGIDGINTIDGVDGNNAIDGIGDINIIDENYFINSKSTNTSAEIAHQPRLWNCLGTMLLEKKNIISAFMEKILNIDKIRIIFTGAGSSAFIGDALSILVAKSAGIKAESIHSTDIVSAPKSFLFADVPTLLISFARSGKSPESMGAVKHARAVIKDLYELAIVCNDTSDLFNLTLESDKSMILVMPEGSNDKGFAMTSSVTCMLLTGFALFHADKINELAQDISMLSNNVASSGIKFTAAALQWAKTDFDRIVYLSCGFLKHIAHEASLKMMELTNGIVNGSFETATGFRHGPKSVIKDKTITVHMISSDHFTAKYDIDLLAEVSGQQKGNKIITICGDDEAERVAGAGDEIITVGAGGYKIGGEICAGIHMLVFCQMLAMFKSISLGICVDNPAPSGEVNRVVKGVNIYY